ncbi:MAG TPA: DUF1385 domain-containing protein [Candidatus Ornithomonoglobus merdipullorum]|uniref:DUF1385 domain-containing protein n=1 Tax=Candidatus Ornithomonoglobus merdipullorum TaxID=2840895 RepID=A0A9D1SER1_9FIRM|nr:DUF1385 domain-containing protein [Candidatus Ornithomonoglobus merdipullorum]
MSKEETKEQHITSIGGQAVMEGVMMRGPYKTVTAVRKPDGEITKKIDENGTKTRPKICKVPIIRGCVSFVDSLVIGMKALMYSAEFVDIEEEEESESKFDRWLEDKLGDKIKDVVIYFAVFLSVIFSVALFILLPSLLSGLVESIPAIESFTSTQTFTSVFEGVMRMAIFLGYMFLISRMKEIKRVFEYHGAEHKTIACYEGGEELTVENVRKYTRFHPRCGTSFLLFVMIISIIVFAFLPRFDGFSGIVSILLRMGTRILCLPIVAGLSFEVIKWAGRSKSKVVQLLSKPGLWLQRLTTREPDDSQIEVAIASMLPCIPENKEEDKW